LSSAKANFEQEKLKFDREKSKMKKEVIVISIDSQTFG
jgi:hypothetical protein